MSSLLFKWNAPAAPVMTPTFTTTEFHFDFIKLFYISAYECHSVVHDAALFEKHVKDPHALRCIPMY